MLSEFRALRGWKRQMPDASGLFLLQQVGDHALFVGGKYRNAVFAEIVYQIEVK